jgi:thiosulfate dehydrogenase (quinone) large subunit
MARTMQLSDRHGHITIQDPPIARLLFGSTQMAWLWLLVRVWVGFQWLNSSLGILYNLGLGGKQGKLFDPAWMASGEAIRGYWERAVTPAAGGATPVVFDWYREFLKLLLATNSDVWFSKVIVAGELLVGLGLVFGALTGIAAFGGSLMNWSFLMAGTVSTNPLMFGLLVLLVLAWKNAGYYGLDRYLLPRLSTPWRQDEAKIELETPAATRPKPPRLAYEPW